MSSKDCLSKAFVLTSSDFAPAMFEMAFLPLFTTYSKTVRMYATLRLKALRGAPTSWL